MSPLTPRLASRLVSRPTGDRLPQLLVGTGLLTALLCLAAVPFVGAAPLPQPPVGEDRVNPAAQSPEARNPEQDPAQDAGAGEVPDNVTLVLEPGQRSLLRLAFPEMSTSRELTGELATAADELESTLREDLDAAGIFQIQGPWAFGSLTLSGDPARDRNQYRSLGNELLLTGDLTREPGKVVFEGRVFDLASGQLILGKRYRGSPDVVRRIAHTFADEILLYFTGERGIALTTLAFHSDRTGSKEIFMMDYDGADQRRVTGHRSISLFPAWEPSGAGLAYVSYVGGRPGIYYADLSSGRKTPILTEGQLNTSPAYSADGQRLAFARSVDGNVEIFSARRDGSGARQLTYSRAIDTNPAWSPRGNEIAFTSSRAGRPDIWVMDPEGANLERISTDGNYNDGASWSPDGTRLVYASRQRGVFQIVVTDRISRTSRVLTSGAGDKESPTFSPDGRHIAFSRSLPGGQGRDTQIWVMDADGRNPRQLTREGNNFSPAWSNRED